MENILNKIKLSQCTGCGLCEYVCPKKCISVAENSEGFFKVSVDDSNCVNCGICSNICHNVKTYTKKDFKLYGGRAKDMDVVENSRSGGLFYLLSKKVIEDGGIAIGAAYVNDFEVKHVVVDEVEDLWKLQGSKYVQSDFRSVFKAISSANKEGKLVIIGATACQIAAVKSLIDFKKLDKSKILLVDIVCYGTPSRSIFRAYLNQYKIFGVLDFDFRDKSFGWEAHYESCFTKYNGKIVSREYANAFCSRLIIPNNCFECRYKNMNRNGDISLADFWGLREKYPELYNKKGNSLFFINTEDGKKIFDLIKNDFEYFEVDKEDDYWKQPVLLQNWEKPSKYKKFWNDYKKHEYKYLKRKYFNVRPSIVTRAIKKFRNAFIKTIKRITKRKS